MWDLTAPFRAGKPIVLVGRFAWQREHTETSISLADRNLIGHELRQIKTLTVRTAEASATFQQNNPDDPQAVYWSLEGETSPNPAAAAWMDKVLRLRASKYGEARQRAERARGCVRLMVVGTDRKSTTVTVNVLFEVQAGRHHGVTPTSSLRRPCTSAMNRGLTTPPTPPTPRSTPDPSSGVPRVSTRWAAAIDRFRAQLDGL